MGAQGSKVNFRQAVIDLTSKPGKQDDESFWEQLWSPESVHSVNDVFAMIPADDVRKLREDSPKNLATLCYKTLEKLQYARDNPSTLCERKVINCIRLLTRLMPYMFEDAEWRGYFWSSVPTGDGQLPMASVLLGILSDLLFCPGFTVSSKEKVDDLAALETCELIWEAGVGFASKPVSSAQFDQNRTEILKLLLTCFSEVIYAPITDESRLRWVARFTSTENRHVLPLFTSLLNVVCAYNPVGMGLPYNYLLFNDSREPLVEAALQVLIVCLDKDSQPQADDTGYSDNYFINYLGRIHREEDFDFMLKKFMFYVLKTSDVLEILVPILYHITESRNDPTRVGLIHMGVFLVLLLSGERNFGVRLNKPYIAKAAIDIQSFTGTHADLLIIIKLDPGIEEQYFIFLGNSNLIYTIIRKRQVFYQLANLPTDSASISKSLSGRKGKAREEMVDQLKSPTAPVAPEIPAGSTAGLAATPQVTSMPGSSSETDGKATPGEDWAPTPEWAEQWKSKLPLQTIMRLLQVLVPQVEKICIDKGLTDESEILKFLQHGTLVGLLPVPHPILIRKYQANAGTNHWFRTYMWGVIYLSGLATSGASALLSLSVDYYTKERQRKNRTPAQHLIHS
ncbi:hypothetical protein ANCCEY_12026 [Ancylostoma ceylanicum]|uniref:Uncharacterized protein n=1 Tax=Ancylostoma ceylanicum TaxID=53326 RepID=A0A0D6LAM8_9BILA|nr:hypothetical protein ANCCEY_12026 [Ancylostoma ceylanicum]